MDISNARNSVVVNHVRLKFYTSIFGAIIKSLLAKKGIFSMMNFRHSSKAKVNVAHYKAKVNVARLHNYTIFFETCSLWPRIL